MTTCTACGRLLGARARWLSLGVHPDTLITLMALGPTEARRLRRNRVRFVVCAEAEDCLQPERRARLLDECFAVREVR